MNRWALSRPLSRRRDEMLIQESWIGSWKRTAKPCNGIIYEETRNLNLAWDGKLISECLSARKIKKKFLAKTSSFEWTPLAWTWAEAPSLTNKKSWKSLGFCRFNVIQRVHVTTLAIFLAPIKANVLRTAKASNATEWNETIVAKCRS